jgi:hypothetical protein
LQPSPHQRAAIAFAAEVDFDGTMDISAAQMSALLGQPAAPFVPADPAANPPPRSARSMVDEDTGDGRTSIITLDEILVPKSPTLPFANDLRGRVDRAIAERLAAAPSASTPPPSAVPTPDEFAIAQQSPLPFVSAARNEGFAAPPPMAPSPLPMSPAVAPPRVAAPAPMPMPTPPPPMAPAVRGLGVV